MFESVVIACDQTTLDMASAIRGVLEGFRLHVYLHFCVQEQNVWDVLAGKIPDSSYVILCATGGGFQVVTKREGVWGPTCVALTPDFVREKVALAGRGIISMGCGTGRQELAQAFLHTGCRAFLGPDDLGPEDVHIDQDADTLFVITFFIIYCQASEALHISEMRLKLCSVPLQQIAICAKEHICIATTRLAKNRNVQTPTQQIATTDCLRTVRSALRCGCG